MKKDCKKTLQLGMNPSTASHRLVKDTLWRLIVLSGLDKCIKCGEAMTRENFSIEHIIPWLDSENPLELYFDQENIAFSHLSCNRADARRPNKIYDNPSERYQAKKDYHREYKRANYCAKTRREKYKRNGT